MQTLWKAVFAGLSLIATPLAVFSAEQEPLVVRLSTEKQLEPLFLTRFSDENSGLSADYIRQLEQVLQFDLSHCGFFQLLPHSRERLQLASSATLKEAGSAARWKALNARYVVKVSLQQQKLSATLLSAVDNQLKSIEGFKLSGNLSLDRKQIHQLADAIVKAFSAEQGVASTRILYTRKYRIANINQWVSELWECDYDGANAKKILSQENGYCITPVYLPPKPGFQASAFFYVSYKNGQPKIYLGSLADGQSQRLTSLRGNQLMPAITKQRDKIAFISDITGNPDLFLQEFSPEKGPIGKPRQIFTTHQATQGSPSFSPDGKKIAFVSNKDGSPRIYVMNIPSIQTKPKDIKAQLISRANRDSTAPCWSPDGSKLAYCARNGSNRQIWIYDFERDEEWQLTQGNENKENPSWAPNSLHLVYNTTGRQGADLYLININHPIPVKISSLQTGEKRFPAWEPK